MCLRWFNEILNFSIVLSKNRVGARLTTTKSILCCSEKDAVVNLKQ